MKAICCLFLSVILLGVYGCASTPTATQSSSGRVAESPPKQTAIDTSLLGYWQIEEKSSTTHFTNIEPWYHEIILFRKDGLLDVQIDAIKYMRGACDLVSPGLIWIKLYHWPRPILFTYSISNGVLTLQSSNGKQVYSYIGAED